MAQADLNVANQSGSAFRADLNNQLLALGTLMSGASEPSTTYAYQWWADTTTGLLKLRNAANNAWITLFQLDGEWSTLAVENGTAAAPSIYFKDSGTDTGIYSPGADQVAISTNGTGRLFVDAAGNVGVGTSTPDAGSMITINSGSIASYRAINGAGGFAVFGLTDTATSDGFVTCTNNLKFNVNGSERVRITSAGRLLVGAATSRSVGSSTSGLFQVEQTSAAVSQSIVCNVNAATGGVIALGKSRGTTAGSFTVVQDSDELGSIRFAGADGTDLETQGARIDCFVDGTPGANDMPGRLVFSTTADGASSPTERMRISNAGSSLFGKTADNTTDVGTVIGPDGYIYATRDSNVPLVINRLTNDGLLVSLRQASVEEGAISVSGTTVTYGGGHLARWSQLPNDEDPASLLKGTVLSNLDEMCEWGDEDNEQLNRMKVSDVEGDPSVAGVFVSASFSDDGPLDFFCAMTGDMIIRIAEGVTVQRGDLLMSAGDGTAKPQDDDIIRSKTIAKVTSTHVTCTYDDGSYCVPCVLMAC
jgi:hypothetical protein